ncbi:hypothetical protein B0H13DRAFT_2341245 [Mycena leptocephala]|nr:hypothetical protein B0H13DRAFT_2341245 [Mycena leptocephala]
MASLSPTRCASSRRIPAKEFYAAQHCREAINLKMGGSTTLILSTLPQVILPKCSASFCDEYTHAKGLGLSYVPYVIAFSTQRCADVLAASNRNAWRAQVEVALAHSHTLRRFLEPCTLAGPSTLALYFTFIPPPPPKSLPTESVFSTESSQCTCVRRRRHAIYLPMQSMRAAVDVPSALLSPASYILACASARGGSESTFCVPRRVCAE